MGYHRASNFFRGARLTRSVFETSAPHAAAPTGDRLPARRAIQMLTSYMK